MYLTRQKIHQFLYAVDWATANSLCLLGYGDTSKYQVTVAELYKMTKTKRVPPLKHFKNDMGYAVFAQPDTKRKGIGDQRFIHDMRLRECLGRYLFDRNLEGIDELTIQEDEKRADARLGKIYFEFDNGRMADEQLEEKIRTRYSGRGNVQVIFWMASRYHEELEEKRLEKLFEICKKVLYDKPNRVIGATYSGFIRDGKLYNYKGGKLEL